MTDDSNDDDKLRARLRDRLGFKSEGEGDGEAGAGDDSIEQEENGGETTPGDETEQRAGDMEEAIRAIAENTDDDVSENDVMDMLEPILGGSKADGHDEGDDDDEDPEEDDEGELKAEEVDSLVAEKLDEKLDDRLDSLFGEKLDSKLDERLDNVVSEGDLDGVVTEDQLDEKLDTVVSALGDEVEETMQKADVGGTPEPGAGGNTELSTDDLLSGGAD